MQAVTIDLDDDELWYRLRCPAGHTQWRAHPEHFECLDCGGRYSDTDPEFQTLHDSLTGRRLDRDEVRFMAEKRSQKIVQEATE